MTEDDLPELITQRLAARLLGVSAQRVEQLVDSGKLRSRNRLVFTASVRERLASPPEPTPRKRVGETWKERRFREVRTRQRKEQEAARIEAGSRELLTYDEACKLLNVSRRTLRRLLEGGFIERVTIDPVTRRVPIESVERFNNFL